MNFANWTEFYNVIFTVLQSIRLNHNNKALEGHYSDKDSVKAHRLNSITEPMKNSSDPDTDYYIKYGIMHNMAENY